MRIGIDISQLAFPGTGVATYTQNLIENLLKIDKKNEYVLFFSSLRQRPPEDFESLNFRFPPTLLEFLWNRLHILPIEKFTGKLDIFHASDWLEPPAACPKVTTIHDLVIYKYPEKLHPKIVANQKRRLSWVKKEEDLIIAVSENTKKDIVEILGIPAEKIRVVHEAADNIFNQRVSTQTIQKVKEKYRIKNDYLLAVGTREPRKNLKRTIQAFKLLKSKDLELVIAGKFGWGEELSVISHQPLAIKFLGYVPKEDLPRLYAGAKVFVYPSLYEGFGLPILEAMATGCPVVTSNVSSLPEVAGEAAILVDPENVEDITRGITQALEEKDSLVKKGILQAKKFSWEKTARETLKVYKEAFFRARYRARKDGRGGHHAYRH